MFYKMCKTGEKKKKRERDKHKALKTVILYTIQYSDI